MPPSCPVCFEPYRDTPDAMPVAAMCGHTLCTGCCRHLVKDKVVTCPICRVRTHAPRGVETLPKIYALVCDGEGVDPDPSTGIQEGHEADGAHEDGAKPSAPEAEATAPSGAPSDTVLQMPVSEAPGERRPLLQPLAPAPPPPDPTCVEGTKRIVSVLLRVGLIVFAFFFVVWVVGVMQVQSGADTDSPMSPSPVTPSPP